MTSYSSFHGHVAKQENNVFFTTSQLCTHSTLHYTTLSAHLAVSEFVSKFSS